MRQNRDDDHREDAPHFSIIYSAEPLSLLTDELEEAVWKEYYLKFIESNIKNIGISSTACYILWQVFNRMADEQYYPPAVPKVDHQKILVKCAKVCFIIIRDQQTEDQRTALLRDNLFILEIFLVFQPSRTQKTSPIQPRRSFSIYRFSSNYLARMQRRGMTSIRIPHEAVYRRPSGRRTPLYILTCLLLILY